MAGALDFQIGSSDTGQEAGAMSISGEQRRIGRPIPAAANEIITEAERTA